MKFVKRKITISVRGGHGPGDWDIVVDCPDETMQLLFAGGSATLRGLSAETVEAFLIWLEAQLLLEHLENCESCTDRAKPKAGYN